MDGVLTSEVFSKYKEMVAKHDENVRNNIYMTIPAPKMSRKEERMLKKRADMFNKRSKRTSQSLKAKYPNWKPAKWGDFSNTSPVWYQSITLVDEKDMKNAVD